MVNLSCIPYGDYRHIALLDCDVKIYNVGKGLELEFEDSRPHA